MSWGFDSFGQVTRTPSGTDFVAIDAGEAHSVALRRDGSVVCWGWDSVNQIKDTPVGPILAGSDGVNPASGVLAGNNQVIIFGTNLGDGSDVTSVTLCGVPATIISQSATQIVVTSGAAVSSGIGDVVVTSTSFGVTTKTDAFTYNPAGIIGSTPPALDLAALNGTNGFVINGVAEGDLSGFSVSGAGDVNGDGLDDLLIGAFGTNLGTGASYLVYGVRAESGVSTSSGSIAGGYEVTISGVNLGNGTDVTNVTLCGISATIISQSSTEIVVRVAAGTPGIGDVVVFSTSFGETVKENAFEYVRVEPFTITSFVPQGTGFLLQFNAIVGQYYAIEYTDNFPTGLWNEVRLPQPATKNQMQWLDTDPAANNRLYRVKQVAP